MKLRLNKVTILIYSCWLPQLRSLVITLPSKSDATLEVALQAFRGEEAEPSLAAAGHEGTGFSYKGLINSKHYSSGFLISIITAVHTPKVLFSLF